MGTFSEKLGKLLNHGRAPFDKIPNREAAALSESLLPLRKNLLKAHKARLQVENACRKKLPPFDTPLKR